MNFMMNEIINWCEYWCGSLTFNQKVILSAAIKKKQFYGVGRAIGDMKLSPLVIIGKTINIINEDGYYELASPDGVKEYKEKLIKN